MRNFVLVLLGLMFWSCAEKVVEKPENLIPKDKMVLILHDLAVLNAVKTSFKTTMEKNEIEVMEFLFEKYEIDSVQFSQSDLYYASVPLEYQLIYEEVESKLDERKSILEDRTKKRNDSARSKNREKVKDTLKRTKKPEKEPTDSDS
ncbi:DUF4296 domain-containing protein [Flagellimonas nanhaiensis]|uniref:DUF4296 domain-containing protein n=1 Tax=Flagellimonas nanhaiensis TaxID=2292706 RepID=A0A371JRV0_9FLAO|nr:DUF4296 domain-containing protein [Allomuricauda nanhaiensis]RDY60242.1 DUF4296 domain-containing protein [Allomuricauda nanhaiensis]